MKINTLITTLMFAAFASTSATAFAFPPLGGSGYACLDEANEAAFLELVCSDAEAELIYTAAELEACEDACAMDPSPGCWEDCEAIEDEHGWVQSYANSICAQADAAEAAYLACLAYSQ